MAVPAKYIHWFFWTLWYLPQPQPKILSKWMQRSVRTFKPFVHHNPDGEFWEIWLSNESTVHQRVTMTLDCQVTEDGRILGVKLYESQLEADFSKNPGGWKLPTIIRHEPKPCTNCGKEVVWTTDGKCAQCQP